MPGWDADDHLAALRAFVTSCGRVAAAVKAGARIGKTNPTPELLAVCEAAERLSAAEPTRKTARAFFEEAFRPHRVLHRSETGLLTGYYEPLVEGSRVKDATFSAPLLRRPGDLVNLVSEAERGAVGERLTHARKDGAGWTPYPTRREIEEGALSGNDLELIYLRDPVDVFFMQVQGSGLVALPDGGKVRVTYDGKNGHPYTSIGRYLIDQGLFPADRMSLQALKRWLRANPERMRDVLWQNQSYVFFRELSGDEATAPRGVLEIPLTPGRSLAVDTAFHVIGTPIYVSSQRLVHATRKPGGFHRLMIAQDVGSAIRGPERGDIYFGSGHHAGSIAGVTKHPGNFYVLLPRQQAGQRDKPPRNRAVPRDTLIDAALPTRKPVRQARQ
ncbi:MAG: MltA domain-containing protein [Hyphomicrobiaceae bacterium]|nr:MltA domain-containing protein [Hyphomicrobiaceae bacterium]